MRCFILSNLCSFQGSTEFSWNKSMGAQHVINYIRDDKKLGSFQQTILSHIYKFFSRI